MAVDVDIVYEGDLHCRATHGPSGQSIVTDAPRDNQGRGEAFSPTDLVAAALGTCMVTIMGIVAKRNNLDLAGTRVRVIKEMVSQPFRRIGSLKVTITVPASARLSAEDRQKLEHAAHHCPVHKSLHPDVQAPVEFSYGDDKSLNS